jgi:hypothetical protein
MIIKRFEPMSIIDVFTYSLLQQREGRRRAEADYPPVKVSRLDMEILMIYPLARRHH